MNNWDMWPKSRILSVISRLERGIVRPRCIPAEWMQKLNIKWVLTNNGKRVLPGLFDSHDEVRAVWGLLLFEDMKIPVRIGYAKLRGIVSALKKSDVDHKVLICDDKTGRHMKCGNFLIVDSLGWPHIIEFVVPHPVTTAEIEEIFDALVDDSHPGHDGWIEKRAEFAGLVFDAWYKVMK